MKKIFTLLTALLCTVVQMSWAEDCPALNAADENSYSTSGGGGNVEYTLNGQGAKLTFQAKKSSSLYDSPTLKIEQYINGSWQQISTFSTSKNYADYGPYDINREATAIRFSGSMGVYTRYIRNVYVTRATYVDAPSNGTLTFEEKTIHSATDTKTTKMLWGNTSSLSANITGDGTAYFKASISDNATDCTNDTATITVTYAHGAVGEHTATLTLTNGDFTHEIALIGTTVKKGQSITWREDIENNKITLPMGKEVNDAATATSGGAVTYSTSDENIVAITNGGASFKAVAAGTAVITATQAGNDAEWNAVSDSINVTVTEKKIQYIHWTDNLNRLLVGDAPVALTAKVQIVDTVGTHTDDPERDQYLSYTSEDANVVSVSGNVLTIVGEGTTTLTATVSGDDEYEEATATMSVRVRTASAGCEDVLVADNLTGGEVEFFQLNTNKIEKAYAIDRNNGVPNKLMFDHKGGKWGLSYGGNIEVCESTDGGSSWSEVLWSQEPTAGTYNNSGEIQLSRNATHVKFTRPKGGTGYHYIKDVVITPAQYLESAQAAIAVDKSIIGDKIEKELVINYSNVKAELVVSHSDIKNVSVQEQYLGNECGAFGSTTLHITIVPTAVGTLLDTIRVKDEVSGMAVAVPIEVQTQRNTQTIKWEDVPSHILTTDTVTLAASAQTAVSFSSSDKTVAYVDATNKLVVVKAGEVTITATATQDEKYEEATLSKTITIALATPTIIAAPTLTVESVGYGEALTNDLLTGGEASVAGVFTWNIAADTVYLPGTHEVPVLFTPENTNWYATAETTVQVVVTKKAQMISWNDVLEGLSIQDTVYLTASAETEVNYSIDNEEVAVVEGNKLYFLAGGTVVVTATAAESELYNEATAEKTIVLGKVKASITIAPVAEDTLTYGQPLSKVALINGEATCAGHFEWVEPTMVQIAGDYQMEVAFIPEDTTAFEGDTCKVYVHIGMAEQEIIWDLSQNFISVGDELILEATATSGYAVTFELDPTNIAMLDGNKLTALAAGILTITAQQDGVDEDGNQNYHAAAPVSFNITIANSSTDNGLVISEVRMHKAVRNGEVVIIRGEEIYNLRGQRVE